MLKIGITGHTNIEKALGYKLIDNGQVYNEQAYEECYNKIYNVLSEQFDLNKLCLVSGMARGADEILAKIAIENNLKLIVCIPGSVSWHRNRGLSRGIRAQAIDYDIILKYNNLVSILEIPKFYNNQLYTYANFARNQALVDNSDIMLVFKYYNSAGTDDCLKRIKQKQIKYINV